MTVVEVTGVSEYEARAVLEQTYGNLEQAKLEFVTTLLNPTPVSATVCFALLLPFRGYQF